MIQPIISGSGLLRRRRIVWFALTMTIALGTIIQLCWKFTVGQVSDTIGLWQSFVAILPEPLFHVALLVFFIQSFNRIIVLVHTDLSYAQPIMALSYVTISGASMAIFHELLSTLRVGGFDQRRVLHEPGLVFSGNCRDHLSYLKRLAEKLNLTPYQEEGIRSLKKYEKPERKGASDQIIPWHDLGVDLFVVVSSFVRSR